MKHATDGPMTKSRSSLFHGHVQERRVKTAAAFSHVSELIFPDLHDLQPPPFRQPWSGCMNFTVNKKKNSLWRTADEIRITLCLSYNTVRGLE